MGKSNVARLERVVDGPDVIGMKLYKCMLVDERICFGIGSTPGSKRRCWVISHKKVDGRGSGGFTEIRILVVLLCLFVVGVAGWIVLRGQMVGYIFAHVGAFGVVGLLGVAAGYIAKKKGRDFIKAFMLGLLVPIVLGVAAVFAVCLFQGPGTPIYCGGSVSLAVSVLMIIGYLLMKRKTARVG